MYSHLCAIYELLLFILAVIIRIKLPLVLFKIIRKRLLEEDVSQFLTLLTSHFVINSYVLNLSVT